MKRSNEFAVGLAVLAALALVIGGALWLSETDVNQKQAEQILNHVEDLITAKATGTTCSNAATNAWVNSLEGFHDKLVARVYDLRVGRTMHSHLTADDARVTVPQLVKREAIRVHGGSLTDSNG